MIAGVPHARQRSGSATALIALCLAGCGEGAGAAPEQRFPNREIVWVEPHQPVPEPPRPSESFGYYYDGSLLDRLADAIPVRHHNRALDTNALGQVPDSGWFENRIGRRTLSPDQIARGPTRDPPPTPPFTVREVKSIGVSVGVIAGDAHGNPFLIKLDGQGYPEIESGAAVIVNRILWAAGYHVPDERVLVLARDDLVVADGSDGPAGEPPLTTADLDRLLERAAAQADGRYRVLVSRYLEGVLLGGFSSHGYRPDDPNDRIPHQRRRSLRGLQPLAAWLQHVDIKPRNSLDVWIPGPSGAGMVRHYLLDFDKSLGAQSHIDAMPYSGHTYAVDARRIVRRLFGVDEPWSKLDEPPVPGIGRWFDEPYDPGAFATNVPFPPFLEMDRFDGYWGAALVARFTPEQLAAVVEQAAYSDPRTAEYVLEVLRARQDQTVRYWFSRVTPLDRFEASGPPDRFRLCVTDLWVQYGLDREAPRLLASSPGGRRALTPGSGGRACADELRAGSGAERYTVIRLDLYRGEVAMPPVFVHLAQAPDTGAMRVIGIQRT
jgi:hypothetical protein